jgi:hypothetical protein
MTTGPPALSSTWFKSVHTKIIQVFIWKAKDLDRCTKKAGEKQPRMSILLLLLLIFQNYLFYEEYFCYFCFFKIYEKILMEV